MINMIRDGIDKPLFGYRKGTIEYIEHNKTIRTEVIYHWDHGLKILYQGKWYDLDDLKKEWKKYGKYITSFIR